MIRRSFKEYQFTKLSDQLNDYGEYQLSSTTGSALMDIEVLTEYVEDNILFKNATYIGFTHSDMIDDSCIIDYESQKLKVLYVNKKGRIHQVFMAKAE